MLCDFTCSEIILGSEEAMSDEHPGIHKQLHEVLPKKGCGTQSTAESQDQMNFKRFCNSVILIMSMETSGVLALG